MPISGRTALVTGASHGIGRAITVELAAAGMRVVAVARDAEALDALAEDSPGVVPCPGDVTDDADRARAVAAAEPVDVLVNNAGTGWLGATEDMPADDVCRLFELNVLAVVDLTQRVLPGMLERRRGHIVNLGSVLGFVATPPLTVYSATKRAVEGFTEGLRREVLGRGVDVTLVTPGAVQGTEVLDRSGGVADGSVLDTAFDATGTSAEAVAAAVRRAVERPSWPGARQLSVPRWAGLSRLAQAPVAARAVDGAVGLLRRQVGSLHRG